MAVFVKNEETISSAIHFSNKKTPVHPKRLYRSLWIKMVIVTNSGDWKKSHRVMPSPWHISWMIRSFTDSYEQLITFPMVDFGTPLFIKSWYCVMFRSERSSVSRLLTASFSCIRITTNPCHCTNYYMAVRWKFSPCACTN